MLLSFLVWIAIAIALRVLAQYRFGRGALVCFFLGGGQYPGILAKQTILANTFPAYPSKS